MKKLTIIAFILGLLILSGCTNPSSKDGANTFCKTHGYNKSTDLEFKISCPRYGCTNIGIECDKVILSAKYCGTNTYDKWGNRESGDCALQ